MDEQQYFEQFVGDEPDDHGYEQYLERFGYCRANAETPMTYIQYLKVLERWDKEYDAAWDNYQGVGVPFVARELEYLLVL